MMQTLPAWLKTASLVCHTSDRTIFAPQRKITFRNGNPHLLDCQENAYPLNHCEPLDLRHIKGIALFVTENATLTLYRDPAWVHRVGEQGFVVSNGTRRVGVQIDSEFQSGFDAAQSLAKIFNGVITHEHTD